MSTASQPLADTPTDPNPRGGPNTEAGKATSSKNATTHGLFTANDVIHPGDESLYAELFDDLRDDLAPEGQLELNLVDEIHRAMWRLRRCGLVESRLIAKAAIANPDANADPNADPIENENTARLQQSVDRARNQAHRLLHKCTAELRRLQTERQFRNTLLEPGTDISNLGICDVPFIRRNIDARLTSEQRRKKLKAAADLDAFLGAPLPSAPDSSFCKTPQAAEATAPAVNPEIPRSAPCPCKSGEKYKRCCGKNAPAMLHAA